MKTGTLFYNSVAGRYDILFDDGSTDGGLHCGEVFYAYIDHKSIETPNRHWEAVRIEYSHATEEWFLVGENEEWLDDVNMDGLNVRM